MPNPIDTALDQGRWTEVISMWGLTPEQQSELATRIQVLFSQMGSPNTAYTYSLRALSPERRENVAALQRSIYLRSEHGTVKVVLYYSGDQPRWQADGNRYDGDLCTWPEECTCDNGDFDDDDDREDICDRCDYGRDFCTHHRTHHA